jgi:pimeloyl-ACP methyl ester carboxylesterase
MAYFDSRGVRIHYEDHDEGAPVILVHGCGTDGAMSIPGQRERIAAALLAENPEAIADDLPRRFRRGVEAAGKDLKALAACVGAEEGMRELAAVPAVRVPVLFLAGTRDRLIGNPRSMTAFFGDSRVVEIEGGDHATSPADRRFHQAIGDFFAHAPA